MLSEYGLKPTFSVNMKTFEEFWLKHKAQLQTGQGYDWNIDPGQRVFIDLKVISFKRIRELAENEKNLSDERYRKATPWEVWLRKNIDQTAWDDLVNMAFDDAVQLQLPPGGKDPDGEPKKVIYPLDAVNRHERPEEKYNKTYYGEDIYQLDKEGEADPDNSTSLVSQNPILARGKVMSRKYVVSEHKGFYYDQEDLERKYCYYPVTLVKTNKQAVHYIYRVQAKQAGNMSRSQVMNSQYLYLKK